MSFMISLRQPDGSDGIGDPRFLVIDDDSGQQWDVASAEAWAEEVLANFPLRRDAQGAARREGDILFLVHGFNVGQADALAFHDKCRKALLASGWNGILISYDWPSDGLVFAYLPDRANARAAASQLVQSGIALLESTQRQDCAVNVHILAHSMGAFVTQQAFTWAYQDVPPGWKVGQVLLVAGDVDYSVFSSDNISAQRFAQHSGRLTAYCNHYDKALLASNAKRVALAPRLGRVGLPDDSPQMMIGVDCSALFEVADQGLGALLSPVATHCFYFDRPEFWQDAVLTLAGGIDRNVMPTRTATSGANRFALKSEPIDGPAFEQALRRAT